MKFLLATACLLTLACAQPAQAQKATGATAGPPPSELARVVRDHRGPRGVKGGGVKVRTTCDKKKYPHCHNH